MGSICTMINIDYKSYIFYLAAVFLILSCGLLESNGNNSIPAHSVYVALQGLDQIGIVNTDSGEMTAIDINFETMVIDGGMNMGNHTPHFIVIDEINRYWFVTTIMSGFIARYDLVTNTLIDKIALGDLPALMVLNENDKKLYVSRMMPMTGMAGSESTIVQEIDYSNPEIMTLSNEFIIGSPTPHGLGINSDGTEVYVASNTADWIYKINIATGEISGKVMDVSIGNTPDIVTQRLKPIQIISVEDSLLFVTCSSGEWYDYINQKFVHIPGQIQLWNSNSMTLIHSLPIDWRASPWHIIPSPNSRMVYVALKGDLDYPGSAGVISISFEFDNLSLEDQNYSEAFQTLHGIDIASDGKTLFVSGRRDGHLHIFNSSDLKLLKSIPLGENYSAALAGGVKVK